MEFLTFRQFLEAALDPHLMSKEEYEQWQGLPWQQRDREEFYVAPISYWGKRDKIRIIKNPKSRDFQEFQNEFRKEGFNGPAIRSTYDNKGNYYIWRSDQGMHNIIEPEIDRLFSVQTSQNQQDVFPDHRSLVKNAFRAKHLSPEEYKRIHEKDYGPIEKFDPTAMQILYPKNPLLR